MLKRALRRFIVFGTCGRFVCCESLLLELVLKILFEAFNCQRRHALIAAMLNKNRFVFTQDFQNNAINVNQQTLDGSLNYKLDCFTRELNSLHRFTRRKTPIKTGIEYKTVCLLFSIFLFTIVPHRASCLIN